MSLSRFFSNLASAYDAEINDLVSDSEGKNVLAKRLADKRSLKLAVGKALDNGWTLTALSPLQATFMYQGQTRQLSLPVLRLAPPSTAPLSSLPNVPRP